MQLEQQNHPVPEMPLDLLLRQGNVHYYAQQYDTAILVYDTIIAIDSENIGAWYNRGTTLGQLGQYDEAIKSFDEAIKLDPDYIDAWYNRGTTLGQLGQ